jgi:hypothetical protein
MEPSSLRISFSDCGSARDSAAGILDDLRGEIRLMLGEICLSRPDLRASISKHPQSSQRLTKMMRLLEIERLPREDAMRLLGNLQLVCADCPSVPRCETWMESDRGGDFRSFCPNAETLDKLSKRRPVQKTSD